MLMRLTCVFFLISASTSDAMPVRWNSIDMGIPSAKQTTADWDTNSASAMHHFASDTSAINIPFFEELGLLGQQGTVRLITDDGLAKETYKDLLPVR